MIVKEKGKYFVRSEEGKNLGGPYDTEAEAKARLKQVEYFKHNKKDAAAECTECDGTGEIDGKDCEKCDGKGYIADSLTTDSIHLNMCDTFMLDDVRKTSDGYLTAFAKVARTGIQIYKGREVGRPDLDEVRVYRSPDEVFHADAMRSMAHRPITLGHPKEAVTAKNWKQFAGGQTGEQVVRDGEFIRIPMIMMDQSLIDAHEKSGVKELSWGYSTDLKWGRGITTDGQPFDAVQTLIRGNHLALVPNARGGKDLRVGDNTGASKMKILIDGVGVDLDDKDAQIVQRHLDKNEKAIVDLKGQVDSLTNDAKTAKATSDAAAVELKKQADAAAGEIVVLKKQVEDAKISPAKLSEMVKDRASLVAKACDFLPKEYAYDSKTDSEIRKDAVMAGVGETAKSLTDDQIAGAFLAMTKDVKAPGGTKALASALSQHRPHAAVKDERDAAYDESTKHLVNAWQTPKPAAAA